MLLRGFCTVQRAWRGPRGNVWFWKLSEVAQGFWWTLDAKGKATDRATSPSIACNFWSLTNPPVGSCKRGHGAQEGPDLHSYKALFLFLHLNIVVEKTTIHRRASVYIPMGKGWEFFAFLPPAATHPSHHLPFNLNMSIPPRAITLLRQLFWAVWWCWCSLAVWNWQFKFTRCRLQICTISL